MPQGELCGSPATIKVKRIKSLSGLTDGIMTNNNLRPIVSGHSIHFPIEVKDLSLYSMLGVEVRHLKNIKSCDLPNNGVYIVIADGLKSKIVIGNM